MGVGIATTMQFASGKASVILAQSEYQDAEEYRKKLLGEIHSLQASNAELSERVEDYQEKSLNSSDGMDELEKELERNEKLLGYEEVRGSGLIITLEDGKPKENESSGSIDSWLRIIHNEDMLKLINELKQNGAEAISINGERITETSEVYCSWAFISINGKKLPAPFIIKTVGDPEKLDAYVDTEFNQIRNMKNRGILVQLEKMPIIILEGGIDPIEPQYLQEIE